MDKSHKKDCSFNYSFSYLSAVVYVGSNYHLAAYVILDWVSYFCQEVKELSETSS